MAKPKGSTEVKHEAVRMAASPNPLNEIKPNPAAKTASKPAPKPAPKAAPKKAPKKAPKPAPKPKKDAVEIKKKTAIADAKENYQPKKMTYNEMVLEAIHHLPNRNGVTMVGGI